ncbi:MAG TPA: alcohol dehydrogenase catalytic domain-containing protein [Ktedonobacterales bacterium]|jgi:threonine dehydrogenase-like Zn-dependent dehydrogenase|nr:alcohol dehydrogenase catalytic domain-containing protein [Ktedonobacterales bacterium]
MGNAMMWGVFLKTASPRTGLTRTLGRFSRRAFYGSLAPLRMQRIAVPALPGTQWVRVRNHIAGISQRDLATIQLLSNPAVSLAAMRHPRRIYLGHQVVGEVVEVGPHAQLLRPGDRVVWQCDPCCPTRGIEPPCHACAAGNFALCVHRAIPASPAPTGGGWSEEMVVHERQLFLVPDALPDEQAALLESAANAVHAALRRQPQPGEQALVMGTDVEGLLLIQALRAFAPNADIAALLDAPYHAEMAARMGASQTLRADEVPEGIARITGSKRLSNAQGAELFIGGFDVVYDTIGSEKSLQSALRWTRPDGAVVLVGQQAMPLSLDLTPVWHAEVTLYGAYAPGVEHWQTETSRGNGRISSFALAASLMRDRRLTPDRLVTHRFPLREFQRALVALQYAEEHQTLQILLDAVPVKAPFIPPAPSSRPPYAARARTSR